MRVQTKLLVFLCLILVAFMIIFVIHAGFEQKRLNLLFNERKNEERVIFDRISDLKGESLKTLAFDYTYWDEMVDFIVSGDRTWAEKTIDTSVLSNYQANAIWIYKTDLSLACSINNQKGAHLEDIPLPKEAMHNLFGKERLCHFFINTPLGLMEIRGATIHPTLDVERKTPPQGYFFAGRLWDKDYIHKLAQLTGGVITLHSLSKKDTPADNLREGLIAFSRVLNDWDNNALMRINVKIKFKSIEFFYQRYQQEFLLLFILASCILVSAVFFLRRTITLPLKLISRTLNTQDAKYINKLEKSITEFGEISRLINESFKQRGELVKEINARQLAEEARQRKEEELRNAYDKLQQIQAQLIQASKMSGIGSLASGVAHEINNPLTGVLNNVQLIKISIAQDKNLNLDDFKELLDSMEESAQRCVKITRALLDFGRPSKGIFQTCSLKEIIGRVLILIRHELEMGNIKIQRDIEPNLPEIKCDPQLLQQAIFDVISNARWAIQKKSPEEGGIITIKACSSQDTDTVDIYITDTGIGIPEEHLKRVFEPFFTTKGVGEGSGLGLFMVYNIIQEHKGNIEVESNLNQGTTFKISLPIN